MDTPRPIPRAYWLRDSASKNGTLLNGEPVQANEAVRLHDDDLIVVGDIELTFLMPETLFSELKHGV